MLSSYDLAVGNIIVKSRVATGLPPLTNPELAASIAAWAEITFGVIPENELERSYVRAMQDRDSSYAIGAPNLIKAFHDNCDSERAAPRIVQDRNLLSGDQCSKCFGSGWEEFRESGYKQVRKCDHQVEGFIGPRDPDSDVNSW
jgi:hypothetical protein